MIDYRQQVDAADRLADAVDRHLREDCSLAVLTTLLLEYRAAQMLVDEELSAIFDNMQKQMDPILDMEQKNVYREIADSKLLEVNSKLLEADGTLSKAKTENNN